MAINWHILPVSRDRYEAAMREVSRLQRRIEKLEDILDSRSMAVLQSSLRKNGYQQIGERDDWQETVEPAPQWTTLDQRMYDVWAGHHNQQTGATAEESLQEWARQYGTSAPSRVLI